MVTATLDRQTLERLADLVLGDERWAPKRRGSYDLTVFFEECGFPDPEYDGSGRRPWVLSRLRSATVEKVETAILRLASPKEYGGNVHQHSAAIAALNAILAVEGMQVRVGPDLSTDLARTDPAYSFGPMSLPQSPGLETPDFLQLLDDKMGKMLEMRWRETQLCFASGAYLATVIMIGSVLETVLLLALRRNFDQISEKGILIRDQNGSIKPLQLWSLGEMIDVCHKLGWTKSITKQFEHVLREYRNLVHPEVQQRTGFIPGSEECRIAAIVLSAVLRDVSNYIAG